MCSRPRSTKGNFCNVVITILVPSIKASVSCRLSRSMALTTPCACSDLIDGVLELAVEHAPIRDHHDAVEALAILVVVQACQTMGEPRDAVGLAAAGGVLDQVVPPRAFLASRRDDLPHRIELVIAGEDHGLCGDAPLTTLAVLGLLLPGLDEQKMPKDVEKAVAREHVQPEVAGAVAGGMLRVAGAAFNLARLAAAIERQEMCLGTRKPCRHVDLVRIGREMHQGAGFEAKERRTGVAVLLVLAHRMAPALAGTRILQLTGGYRKTIQREHEDRRCRACPDGKAPAA